MVSGLLLADLRLAGVRLDFGAGVRRVVVAAMVSMALFAALVVPAGEIVPSAMQDALSVVTPEVVGEWFGVSDADAAPWDSVWGGVKRVGSAAAVGAGVFGTIGGTAASVGCTIGYATGFGKGGCAIAGGTLAAASLPVATAGFWVGFSYGLFKG